MTILPELRDVLARERPILPELPDGLVAARPRRRRFRPAVAALLTFGTVGIAAGALTATGVIGTGDPVEPRQINRDPARGVGVPADGSAQLVPLRVADPDGGPPWSLRLAPTSRGMLCLQVGRVVDERFGRCGRAHPRAPGSRGRQLRLPVRRTGRRGALLHRVRTLGLGGGRAARAVLPRGRRKATRPADLPAGRIAPCRVRAARAAGFADHVRGREFAGAERGRRVPVRGAARRTRARDRDGRRAERRDAVRRGPARR